MIADNTLRSTPLASSRASRLRPRSASQSVTLWVRSMLHLASLSKSNHTAPAGVKPSMKKRRASFIAWAKCYHADTILRRRIMKSPWLILSGLMLLLAGFAAAGDGKKTKLQGTWVTEKNGKKIE